MRGLAVCLSKGLRYDVEAKSAADHRRQVGTQDSQEQAGQPTQRDEASGVSTECGWHRYRSQRNLCRRAGGSGRTSRPQVRDFHWRSAPDGGMAGALWHHHGGDGIHWRLLDSRLRSAGAVRHPVMPDESAEHEERAGQAHGFSRVPVDPVFAFDGIVAFGVPAGRRSVCGAFPDASPQRSGGNGQPACAAHAESPHPDECAVPPCDLGHYRLDGVGDPGRHRSRRARSSSAGQVAGPPH